MQGFSKKVGTSQSNSILPNLCLSIAKLHNSLSMSGFVHLLFGVFHRNPKTAGPQRYVLEIFHSGGENLIPEDLLTLPYV